MRAARLAGRRALALGAHGVLLLMAPGPAFGASVEKAGRPDVSAPAAEHQSIDSTTWVDHDGRPIAQPPDWEPKLWAYFFRQAVVDPLAHAFDIPDKLLMAARPFGPRWPREAVNVNAYDEVPSSTWFTNRNPVRAISTATLRAGPHALGSPTKPWTITQSKSEGYSAGFQIKDAAGKKWVVKLDPKGKGGESLSDAELDSILTRGAVFADGSYSAYASLFVEGSVLGWPSMYKSRPFDTNDWYHHVHRRELRGLFVICSWIGNWDTKDSNLLDSFVPTRDSLGHVQHYILDSGASLGAAASGPKAPFSGFEHYIDFGWVARRLVTLGFIVEPWRRARQDSGIPSAGNFEAEVYRPEKFKPYVPHPAFRLMTDRDGYWGAKIVASFSQPQIAAVVQGVGYEDPRATEFLTRILAERRDKIVRHWFARVAPLDFFWVEAGALRFHDLAVDLGLAATRPYDVRVAAPAGSASRTLRLAGTALDLDDLGDASRLTLTFSIAEHRAKPVLVELMRRGSGWIVLRVEHA